MPDIYDNAIAYLREHPTYIRNAWTGTEKNRGGALFMYATPDGLFVDEQHRAAAGYGVGEFCGCLTQIRSGTRSIIPGKALLTAKIRHDASLPCGPDEIRVVDLPRFAHWQRRLDAAFPGRHAKIKAACSLDAEGTAIDLRGLPGRGIGSDHAEHRVAYTDSRLLEDCHSDADPGL